REFMSTTQRAGFALMVGLLGSCLSLPAQETQGGIQGTVKDASGGAVPNATIEISGPALFGTRKIQTDSAGAYRFWQLPPGDYTSTASERGFATIKQPGIHVLRKMLSIMFPRAGVDHAANSAAVYRCSDS